MVTAKVGGGMSFQMKRDMVMEARKGTNILLNEEKKIKGVCYGKNRKRRNF